MSRNLIIYYSRSGATRAIADELATALNAETIPIEDTRPRHGAAGYMRSLMEAARGSLPAIEPVHIDASNYDLILLGTPVWAAHASSPMRRFLFDTGHALPATAYFCTYGGRGYESAFQDMQALTGTPPLATLAIRNGNVRQGHHQAQMDRFLAKLASAERSETGVASFGPPPVRPHG